MTLFETIKNYDKEKINYLTELWQQTLDLIKLNNDHNKIISFLGKCGIIGIEEKDKTVYLGVPNEFILSQVRKFFGKELRNCIQEIYNPHFKVDIIVFEPFQSGRHDLQVTIKVNKKLEKAQKEKVIDKSTKDELKNMFGILFDSKYKLDNFVVGANNQLAYGASKQASEKPGLVYNPLFIYGNVGLGKTHLLQAIGNQIINEYPEKVVVYLPTSKLIDEIIEGIRKNKLQNLMKKLDQVDVIILDDVQFLAEKERTQIIVHNIFNDFHMKKKQIVLSSDRPPKDLKLLEARLRSRFAIGLVVDIKKPDFETRVAIMQSKLKNAGERLDAPLLELIARYVKDNIRELEGALNSILMKKHLLGKDISEKEILETIETLGYNVKSGKIYDDSIIEEAGNKNLKNMENFSKIVEFVSNYYNVSIYDIKGDSRKREVSLTRQMLMYVAKKYFQWTLEKIGDYFGGKNHATVIYAINNFKKTMKFNKKVNNDFHIILEELNM